VGEVWKWVVDGCAWCFVAEGSEDGGSRAFASLGEGILLCPVWHVCIGVACIVSAQQGCQFAMFEMEGVLQCRSGCVHLNLMGVLF